MSEEYQGPTMWVATSVMKPPPTLIGKVGPSFTLPRPVTLLTAVAIGVGAVLGLALALVVVGANSQSVIMGVVLGGTLGWLAVTVQPMKNESLAKWLGLQFQSVAAKKVTLDGVTPVRLYLGIAPLKRVAAGPIMLVPGGVEVQPDQYDERGVPIPLGSAAPVELTAAPLQELRESKTEVTPLASDVPFELPAGGGRRGPGGGGPRVSPHTSPEHMAPMPVSAGSAPHPGAPMQPAGGPGAWGAPAGGPVIPAAPMQPAGGPGAWGAPAGGPVIPAAPMQPVIGPPGAWGAPAGGPVIPAAPMQPAGGPGAWGAPGEAGGPGGFGPAPSSEKPKRSKRSKNELRAGEPLI